MTPRRYNLLLAAIFGPVVTLMIAASFFLQPYDGELTRLGGFPESRYGWQTPQLRFAPPLYQLHKPTGSQYVAPAGVVVLGDSFTTHRAEAAWPNYLVRATGLRVQAFPHGSMTVDQLAQSDGFRRHPPRVVIYQMVERNLMRYLPAAGGACRATNVVVPAPYAPVRQPVEPQPIARDTRPAALDLSLSIDFLTKTLSRELFGYNWTRAKRLALTRDAPFSGPEKRQLLIYRNDLRKSPWTDADWDAARCRLIDLQNRVQANGRTYFVAMIAPDKLTAYSDFLADRRLAALSRLERLAADPALHLPRIDLALKRAIRDGVADVYLANDTHWGSAGYEIAAQEVLAHLVRAGVVSPVSPRRPLN
jgi:hypothetical protein